MGRFKALGLGWLWGASGLRGTGSWVARVAKVARVARVARVAKVARVGWLED